MSEFVYIGSELELFAAVHNWKQYWARIIRPWVAGEVLEVGAGIGSNTTLLDPGGRGQWTCLEPDPRLFAQLGRRLKANGERLRYEPICATLRDLDAKRTFDTIIYIDVLEHIEDDRGELERAASRLRPMGRLIVLSPAHNFVFAPFDAAIGHFRRYDRPMLRAITPPGLRIERLVYLDSAGLILSLANRLLLRQSMPGKGQLRFWDACVIPVSRVLDPCLGYSVGKTIVGMWKRS